MNERWKKASPSKTTARSPEEAFAARLREFERFYLYLVIGCGALCAIAIGIAVIYKVSVGVIAAVLTALIYWYFLADELKKQLGLRQRRVEDGIAVTVVRCPAEETELRIPEKLLWLEVTELASFAEGQGTGLKTLYCPATLRRIGADALASCPALEIIEFNGTAEQWDAIEKTDLSGVKVIIKGI